MKNNRKNRKKMMLHKCENCGQKFRAFDCPHLNTTLWRRDCPKCGCIPVPF